MTEQFDLSSLAKLGDVSVKPSEHPDDRITRLEAERRDLKVETYKNIVVFGVFITSVVAVGILCMFKLFLDATATDEVRRWSQTMLSSLLAGAASFVAGRKIGSKSS